jgi:hypothetical protein
MALGNVGGDRKIKLALALARAPFAQANAEMIGWKRPLSSTLGHGSDPVPSVLLRQLPPG